VVAARRVRTANMKIGDILKKVKAKIAFFLKKVRVEMR
jgi:hypothetical protein